MHKMRISHFFTPFFIVPHNVGPPSEPLSDPSGPFPTPPALRTPLQSWLGPPLDPCPDPSDPSGPLGVRIRTPRGSEGGPIPDPSKNLDPSVLPAPDPSVPLSAPDPPDKTPDPSGPLFPLPDPSVPLCRPRHLRTPLTKLRTLPDPLGHSGPLSTPLERSQVRTPPKNLGPPQPLRSFRTPPDPSGGLDSSGPP